MEERLLHIREKKVLSKNAVVSKQGEHHAQVLIEMVAARAFLVMYDSLRSPEVL